MLFGYYWARIWKYCCHIWNQPPQFCLFAKFDQKTKMPRFRTRNAWFRYFLGEMWKQYCPIRNQHPHICLIAKFGRKTKMRKFGIKNPLFGYFDQKCFVWVCFGENFKNTIVIFEISILKFVFFQNRAKTSRFCYFRLEFETILSYLKSDPSNLSNCKIWRKK